MMMKPRFTFDPARPQQGEIIRQIHSAVAAGSSPAEIIGAYVAHRWDVFERRYLYRSRAELVELLVSHAFTHYIIADSILRPGQDDTGAPPPKED